MREFFSEHPILTGLLLAAAVFILNSIRRLIAAGRRMPRKKRLEYTMRRGAMAVRKLARARRILSRFVRFRNATRGTPIPAMVRRLWKASSDAGDAQRHLAAVLKKGVGLDAGVDVLRNLDQYLEMAKDVRANCRREVRAPARKGSVDPVPGEEEIKALAQKCGRILKEVRTLIEKWVGEVDRAEKGMAETVDPTILHSGGLLRSPFKSEDSVEDGQVESVFSLRRTREDINRVQRCFDAATRALDVLESEKNPRGARPVTRVGAALDAIDVALADAEMPLPKGLAAGETPYDSPTDAAQPGALQQLYALLAQIEAHAAAGGNHAS